MPLPNEFSAATSKASGAFSETEEPMELMAGDIVEVESNGTVGEFEVYRGDPNPCLRAAKCYVTFPDHLGRTVTVRKRGDEGDYIVESYGITAIGGDLAGKQVTDLSLRSKPGATGDRSRWRAECNGSYISNGIVADGNWYVKSDAPFKVYCKRGAKWEHPSKRVKGGE